MNVFALAKNYIIGVFGKGKPSPDIPIPIVDEEDRQLATVREILDILPIEGADNIELALIDGWQCVTAKDNGFKKGDLCIYVEIDSVLPEHEEFEFLRSKKFRIKTIKLRGQLSQGIIFPLSILDKFLLSPNTKFALGDDVTKVIGITKYEAPIPANLAGKIKGNFPSKVPKTAESRIQNLSRQLRNIDPEMDWTASEKLHGCLDESTLIDTEDGIKTIQEICETKYSGKVKSYDIETGEIYWDKISNHSILENNDEWYEIELEDGQKIKLTGNHKVWISNLLCYRAVSDLVGDEEFLTE